MGVNAMNDIYEEFILIMSYNGVEIFPTVFDHLVPQACSPSFTASFHTHISFCTKTSINQVPHSVLV